MKELVPYYRVFIIPVSVLIGCSLSGWYSATTVTLTFIALPILELILPRDLRNLNADEMERLEHRVGFRFITWLWVPVQLCTMVVAIHTASQDSLTWFERICMTLSVGVMCGGIGITVAHELMHRAHRAERVLGDILLASVLYMHFRIEHVRGHHRNVATPDDPATSRRNESLYSFFPRVLVHSWRSAWQLEAKRLLNKNLSVWSIRNMMIQFTLVQSALCVTLYILFGGAVVTVFVTQAIISFLMLEIIDYIEHYGLQRRRREDGSYERVSEAHSWEATARLTNTILFKLQRHSDHHLHPGKRYHTLLHTPESPQMPTGYAGMVMLALVPPIFKRVMNARIDAYEKAL